MHKCTKDGLFDCEFGRKYHCVSSIFHLAPSVASLLCMAVPLKAQIGLLPLLPLLPEQVSTACQGVNGSQDLAFYMVKIVESKSMFGVVNGVQLMWTALSSKPVAFLLNISDSLSRRQHLRKVVMHVHTAHFTPPTELHGEPPPLPGRPCSHHRPPPPGCCLPSHWLLEPNRIPIQCQREFAPGCCSPRRHPEPRVAPEEREREPRCECPTSR